VAEHQRRSRGAAADPECRRGPWPIAPRQFRRTLAREIAFRPHGKIASKIQLKHVHAHVTEGYWGPAGESAQRFIDELDREQRAASEQRKRADTLHFGVLNDCHFTDPSQARCLRNARAGAPDAPLIAACQPARVRQRLDPPRPPPRLARRDRPR
jgi:hypothetical protein